MDASLLNTDWLFLLINPLQKVVYIFVYAAILKGRVWLGIRTPKKMVLGKSSRMSLQMRRKRLLLLVRALFEENGLFDFRRACIVDVLIAQFCNYNKSSHITRP